MRRPPGPQDRVAGEGRRQKVRRRWRALVVVEDDAAIPPIPLAVVPEGQGPGAVLDAKAAAPCGVGQPGARVHIQPRLLEWCHDHPLLQEVQHASVGSLLQEVLQEYLRLIVFFCL
jgi:hypothetical protein|uniref:Uncharacterized protein n=1 Tax=Zea mays TaxID=4577 RepID=A0A804NN21_MAIZE